MPPTEEPRLRDVMTPQPHYIVPSATLAAAKEMMERFGIRHLPVMSAGGKPVGMLSQRDINLACGIEGIDPSRVVVMDACHGRPYVVDPQAPLREVAREMAASHYGSAIVMHGTQLVGIFTTVDACRMLVRLIQERVDGA